MDRHLLSIGRKLISHKCELFNHTGVIGETTNMADTNPKKVQELSKVLTSYLKEVDAQLPTHKDSGEVVAYPGL